MPNAYIAFCIALLALTFSKADHSTIEKALKHLASHESQYIDDLKQLVSFPSVSASPQRLPDLLRAAEWLVDRCTAAGLKNAEILPNPAGPRPAVYAEYISDIELPTVLVYGHFDVQPADPEEAWTSLPFKPQVRDGAVYGRGASDDKGGLLAPLQAFEALYKTSSTLKLPINLKFFIEGEEEIGSPFLPPFLQKYREKLACDIVLSADGGQINATQPGLALGLRGAVALEVQLTALPRDVHSGMLGGAVQNSNRALVHLLATLHDPITNVVLVKGFYDKVRPITNEDRSDMAALGFNEKTELLGSSPIGEINYTSLERIWHRPTLEIVGIGGGYAGEGIKTVIPATAIAKLAARLVPDQTPEEIASLIESHVIKNTPPGCNVTVRPLGFRAAPFVTSKKSGANAAAATVLKDVYGGVEPLWYRGGATIPALAAFQEYLGAETTVFGFALPTDTVHAPDERYELRQYRIARDAYVKLFHELGEAAVRGELAKNAKRNINDADHTEL